VKYSSPGQFRDIASFRAHLRALDPAFDLDEELTGADGPLGRGIELFGRRLSNRFAAQPMEGWDATREGWPSEATLRRWRRFGRSTAKLVWGGEAVAVQEDGRANPHQLFLAPRSHADAWLVALRAQVLEGHREMGADPSDLVIGLQLTHSGRFARPDGVAAPRLVCHSPALDARVGVAPDAPLLTDGELEAIGESTVRGARLAWNAGFDFIDLKCCHGYLLHELLGATTRPGPYGGSFENRTRLVRAIVAEVRARCPGLALGARVSVGDLVPHERDPESGVGRPVREVEHPYRAGFGVDADEPTRMDPTEPLRFLGLLEELGITLVNVTLGSPYTCPHLQRPAATPPSDGYLPPVDPLVNVLDHLRTVRLCRRERPGLTLVGSGYTYLMEYLPHVAQREVGEGHVDFVGLGRMMLSYPELPADVLAGRALDRRRLCRTFSDCTTGPRQGWPSGCYPLDPVFRASPGASAVRDARRRSAP